MIIEPKKIANTWLLNSKAISIKVRWRKSDEFHSQSNKIYHGLRGKDRPCRQDSMRPPVPAGHQAGLTLPFVPKFFSRPCVAKWDVHRNRRQIRSREKPGNRRGVDKKQTGSR